jgi:hypothetical protein
MTSQPNPPILPTWRELHQDTTPEAEVLWFRAIRALPSARKFELLVAHNNSVLEIARSGIRQQFPDASAEEVRYRLALRLWGESIARYFEVVDE